MKQGSDCGPEVASKVFHHGIHFDFCRLGITQRRFLLFLGRTCKEQASRDESTHLKMIR